jgi:eukaryotic-like serine/threonine-protein kinase
LEFTQLKDRLQPNYILDREIGRGGMAVVYLAHDLKHDRQVAIKVLGEDVSMALGPARFRREIQFASKLSHPHILPIFDSGEVEQQLYCVMPFIDGESLKTRIHRDRQLAIDEAIRIGCEVASAIDFAHRSGILHRDIKPENILLTKNGDAIVADFGIARAINEAGDEVITRSGITLGTPGYMSPEQAAADKHLDGRSDIYSLGCCVYEMLAGSPPFSGPTAQVLIARHTLEQAPPLQIARQTIPDHVAATVMRALAKSPADRFKTAGEFADGLSGKITVTMPRISGVGPAYESTPRVFQRKPVLLSAGLTLLLAGFIVTAYLRNDDGIARATTSDLDATRVAVMYFEDRTNGRLAYLADGLTESLIDRLAVVRGLDVVSANGVVAFRGEQISADVVARELKAGTIVQASLEERRGDSIRVTLRLVEGASGADFERTVLDGSVVDPLKLRDDLADQAAEFLRKRLGDEIKLQQRRADTRNPEAWGLAVQSERIRKDAESLAAEDALDSAAVRFARADSLLADAERLDQQWSEPIILRAGIAYRQARLEPDRLRVNGHITRGLEHVARALAHEARNADALELRGSLRYVRWLFSLEADPMRAAALMRDAEVDLRSAVAISPTNASAWSVLSHLHYQKPDFTEAKLAAQRAYEEDAYLSAAPDIVWRLYTTSYDLEDFAGADQWCRKGRERFPQNARFVECRLWLLTARGSDPDIALAWSLVDSIGQRTPDEQWEHGAKKSAELVVAAVIARAAGVDSGRRTLLADSARQVLRRSKPTREEDPEGELIGTEAFAQTLLGDKDEVFRLLKEYFALNPGHRALFAKGNSWWWRPLKDDPRFAELVGHAQ